MAKRILVFDDKPENLRVAKQAYDKLAKYGFSVETTSNPDEALDKIERGEADILVTDLYAPREMISPRILDKWKGLTTQAAKYFKGEEGSYEIQDSDGEPIDLKKRTKGRKASDKRYALGRPASYKFHHPKWGADVRVPYDEVASINRVMSMEPTRTERRNAKSPGMRDWKFWENNLLPPTIKPSNEDFTLEEFKRLNPDVDEESLELIHKHYQKGRSVYIEKMKEAQKDVPVGVVLYAAAQEKGIPANIVSDTHRHALQGHTRDIRGGVLPLLVKDPSLVIETKDKHLGGYMDPSRIRTNANKQEVSNWYYGGGYETDSASFLPEELRGLSGKTLEEKLEQKVDNEDTGLGKKLTPVIATLGLLSGIFFLSSNITGNAIADMTTKTTSFLGAGLLIVGLVAGFFWLKGRKR